MLTQAGRMGRASASPAGSRAGGSSSAAAPPARCHGSHSSPGSSASSPPPCAQQQQQQQQWQQHAAPPSLLRPRRSLVVTAARAGGAASGTGAAAGVGGRRRARKPEDLVDPAKIGSTGTNSVRVPDYGGDVSLSKYMTLPVEQYFVLDPQQIRWIEGNRFNLKVPRVQILDIWLEPEVEISVTLQSNPQRVVLTAENCSIRGSDLIERMQIDQKFCMRFTTELTWAGKPDNAHSDNGVQISASSSPSPTAHQGSITGRLALDVWCEVIPPFNMMPREVLQGTCNVVMQGLTGSLLPLFVDKLAADYRRWATDAKYRADRAARAAPLAQV